MGVPRLVDEDQDAQRGDHPHRHVDVEHPAPAVIVGQPAPERRTDNRAQYDTHAPDRHRLGVPVRRIDLQQHGLRQGHQRRARDALQQAVDYYLDEARGAAA